MTLPYPPGKLSVFVFEDDFPLNGEHDAGGLLFGVSGSGLRLMRQVWAASKSTSGMRFGQFGDFTGQMGFDMFNEPLSNSLAGTVDPATGFDACPVSKNPLIDHAGTPIRRQRASPALS